LEIIEKNPNEVISRHGPIHGGGMKLGIAWTCKLFKFQLFMNM